MAVFYWLPGKGSSLTHSSLYVLEGILVICWIRVPPRTETHLEHNYWKCVCERVSKRVRERGKEREKEREREREKREKREAEREVCVCERRSVDVLRTVDS
jgi:hypothetical protein